MKFTSVTTKTSHAPEPLHRYVLCFLKVITFLRRNQARFSLSCQTSNPNTDAFHSVFPGLGWRWWHGERLEKTQECEQSAETESTAQALQMGSLKREEENVGCSQVKIQIILGSRTSSTNPVTLPGLPCRPKICTKTQICPRSAQRPSNQVLMLVPTEEKKGRAHQTRQWAIARDPEFRWVVY